MRLHERFQRKGQKTRGSAIPQLAPDARAVQQANNRSPEPLVVGLVPTTSQERFKLTELATALEPFTGILARISLCGIHAYGSTHVSVNNSRTPVFQSGSM